MIGKIRKLSAFTKAAEAASSNTSRVWIHGLCGALPRLIAGELAESLGRPMLYVTHSTETAETAVGDLESLYDSNRLFLFPPREFLPPAEVLPPDTSVSERLVALRNLLNPAESQTRPIVVAPIRSILQRLPQPSLVAPVIFSLRVGDTWPLEELSSALVQRGYHRSSMVETRGEFSIRGGIVDVFPMCAQDPFRIEFFGDEVESIRVFDVVTQRSFEKLDQIQVMPRNRWVDSASDGEASLLDYLPKDAIIAWDEPLLTEREASQQHLAPLYDVAREELAICCPGLTRNTSCPLSSAG
ncbi:MAG: hypothetical protein HY801_10440 [Candidatus Lindowbacteria bacterium]|nr:hypothetical protein [Candidatus Lindowbacteria bacterium]